MAANLPLGAAVELAHGLVEYLAQERGIRIVFLKGPIAVAQGLREADYVSGDVDAFCEPGREQDLVAALRERGWVDRPESEGHAMFVTHSVTLLHPDWPCDIDVHTSYPGFLASPEQVFAALWARRERHALAGVPVWGPDRSTQTAVILLHGLRAPFLLKNQREIEQSHGRIAALPAAQVDEVVTLLHETGADEVVHDFFAALGRPIAVPDAPTAEYLRWRLITQPSRTEGWVAAISGARGRERLMLIYRAVLPTREHLAIDHPQAAVSTGAALRAYLTRLTRAARLAPTAVCNVVAARRAQTHVQVAPVPPPPSPAPAVVERSRERRERSPESDAATPPAPHPDPALAADAAEAGDALAVYVGAGDAGPHHDRAFVLPLSRPSTQSPFEVNLTGLDVLTLLVDAHGDVAAATRRAAELWTKPAAEVGPAIAEFHSRMVQLGAL